MILTLLAAATATPAPAAPPAPVEVMVLGAYHFDNPGQDKVNVTVDDVTAPRRQRELEALADALVRFRPTRVMVERVTPAPMHAVADYARFTPALLLKERGEDVQIAYRVAARMKLPSVEGIDARERAGTSDDFFPAGRLETWAKAAGRGPELESVFQPYRDAAAVFAAEQATTSIPVMLQRYNDPATPQGGQSQYYAMLRFGAGDDQPGADLNAGWYQRNARIFAKLMQATKPGDRVLVVFGAGHGYWLRHFAATAPGYTSVDVRPYLQQAAAALSGK